MKNGLTRSNLLVFAIMAISFLTGCATPTERVNTAMQGAENDRLTLGKIQQVLKKGMKQDEVVAGLGSPNMVTRDRNGLETWIYDKLSTEVKSASASDRLGLSGAGAVVGGSSAAVLGLSGGQSNAASSTTRSQKSLTLILKFQEQSLVDFSYHSSSF